MLLKLLASTSHETTLDHNQKSLCHFNNVFVTSSVLLQPQGDLDGFISNIINENVDLDGSVNGSVSGGASYYSPVIHTTTIGPLQPGVTYYYRVSFSAIAYHTVSLLA